METAAVKPLSPEEGMLPTAHDKIMVLRGPKPDWDELRRIIDAMEQAAANGDAPGVVAALKEAVPEYSPWTKTEGTGR